MKIIEELQAKMAKLAENCPEMSKRLQLEVTEAQKSNRLTMLAKASGLMTMLNEKGFHAELSPAMGYPLSYLCFQMGITDMNPFDYPEVETLDFVLATFRNHKYIVIFTDKGGKAAADEIMPLKTPDFEIIIKESLECNRRTRTLDAINSSRKEKMSLENIPSNSKEAFEVIHNLDWDGVTETFVSTSEMKAARDTDLDTFEKVWGVFCSFPYGQIKDRRNDLERFEEARRACQLAYLKIHFPEEFNDAIEEERLWENKEE